MQNRQDKKGVGWRKKGERNIRNEKRKWKEKGGVFPLPARSADPGCGPVSLSVN